MIKRILIAISFLGALFSSQAAWAQNETSCIVPKERAALSHSWYDPQPSEIAGAKSYTYKSISGTDLRLHVFEPRTFDTSADAWISGRRKGEEKLPAIVIFYGGAWSIGTIERFRGEAVHLASRGMVAILADYRVYCRNKTHIAAAVSDAKSAIRWVRGHATELGIDPDRLAAGGGSAGAHIALSTATLDDFDEPSENKAISSKPNALVLFYPAVDLAQPSVASLKTLIDNKEKELSPIDHIRRGLPPTLIMAGTADALYPSAEKYCSDAKSLGNDCKFVSYEGAPHGFDNAGVTKPEMAEQALTWYKDALAQIDSFLERLKYLKR
jgi:acetyl esterase/lipase